MCAGDVALEAEVMCKEGDVLRQLGQSTQALEVLEQAASVQPLHEKGAVVPLNTVEIHLTIGAVLSQLGDHRDSLVTDDGDRRGSLLEDPIPESPRKSITPPKDEAAAASF